MNINTITPIYNNQPINPIEAIKTGAAQVYTQKITGTQSGDFLSVLYGALQKTGSLKEPEGRFETTMISKEISDFSMQSQGLLVGNQNTHDNFFSLLNSAYHGFAGVNAESIAGLPSNFAGYLAQKIGNKKDENSLFNEGVTSNGDIKRAKRSYQVASSESTNTNSQFFEA